MYASPTERAGQKRGAAAGEAVLAALAGLVAAAVYVLTLAPTVATNDAGRFQIAAPLLGTGHPTGYPTFILFGKLFTFLPFGDLAYRVNLMAAVFGGLACALLFVVARSLGAGRIPAFGAALLFAFTATFWSQATFAEVYSMHIALVLLVTALLLRWRQRGGSSLLVLAGLVAGLSLGNNAGTVLFAPTFLVLLFAGTVGGSRPKLRIRGLAAGALAFLAGLSVYAYVPIRGFAGAWHNYGDPVNNWADVWTLVSGARFQGLMDPTPATILSNVGGFLYHLAHQAPQPFGYALLVLLLVGGLAGLARLIAHRTVPGVALGLGLLVTLVYALSYGIDDIDVYYLPVYALLCVSLAVAATGAAGWARWTRPLAVAPVLVAAFLLGANFESSDRSGYTAERERAEQDLAALPEGAILYGKVPIIPATYLTEVEGERPDVTLRWLDGGTLERNFERDLRSGRPVLFLPEDSERYLEATESRATRTGFAREMILFEPR